jgi:hypothetical protein
VAAVTPQAVPSQRSWFSGTRAMLAPQLPTKVWMVVSTPLLELDGPSGVFIHSMLGTLAPLKKMGQLPLMVTILLPETFRSAEVARAQRGESKQMKRREARRNMV